MRSYKLVSRANFRGLRGRIKKLESQTPFVKEDVGHKIFSKHVSSQFQNGASIRFSAKTIRFLEAFMTRDINFWQR